MFLFLGSEDHQLDSTHFGWGALERSQVRFCIYLNLSYWATWNYAICNPSWHGIMILKARTFRNKKLSFPCFPQNMMTKSFKAQSWWCFGCFFLLRYFFGKVKDLWWVFFIFFGVEKIEFFWKLHSDTPESPWFSWRYERSQPVSTSFSHCTGWERACFFGWTLVGGTGHRRTSARCFGAAPGYHLGSVILSAFLKTLFRGRVFWVCGCLFVFCRGTRAQEKGGKSGKLSGSLFSRSDTYSKLIRFLKCFHWNSPFIQEFMTKNQQTFAPVRRPKFPPKGKDHHLNQPIDFQGATLPVSFSWGVRNHHHHRQWVRKLNSRISVHRSAQNHRLHLLLGGLLSLGDLKAISVKGQFFEVAIFGGRILRWKFMEANLCSKRPYFI